MTIKILCIIPARSGSKGIKDKNIRNYKDKPLMAWSIEQALSSKYKGNMRVVVSTDSEQYANIAINCGAEAPFLIPDNISGDLSLDFDMIKHCVEWLNNNQNYSPDIILQLRPTSPTRKVEDIDNAIDIFINNREKYDSLRSVVKSDKSPYKMYNINNNKLIPLFTTINDISEPTNACRQMLPDCYLHNGYIDIFNNAILTLETVSGENIYPFIMNDCETIDIDTETDWSSLFTK